MLLHTTLLTYSPKSSHNLQSQQTVSFGPVYANNYYLFCHCCPLAFPVYLSIDIGNLDTRKSPFHTSVGISDYHLGTEWIINGNNILICHLLNLTPHVTLKYMKFMNDIPKIIIFSCQYSMITSHWFSDDKSICGKYSISRCKKFSSDFSFELNFSSSRSSNERKPMPMHCKKGGNRLKLPLKPMGQTIVINCPRLLLVVLSAESINRFTTLLLSVV